MLDTFLHQGGKFILEKDKNYVYLVEHLKRLHIDIRDKDGKAIMLADYAFKAGSSLATQWNDGMSAIAGGLQMLNQTPITPMTVYLFNAGFGFGMLWERLRSKRGITVQLAEDSVTSEEMAEVVRRYNAAHQHDEEDEDGE